MLNVKNDIGNIEHLFALDKKLVLYGAGASTVLFLKWLYRTDFWGKVEFIVDRDDGLNDTWCQIGENARVRVISLRHFLEQYRGGIRENFTFLIMPSMALLIVPELDQIRELDGVDAYIRALICIQKKPNSFQVRTTDYPLIPKRIHYIWIGGSSLPEEDARNIEGWKKLCPDYEIIRWDESNYDFRKNAYMQEALDSKQYMYATDYARKDILYQYGGIYLDTDVELRKSLDELLYNQAFIGMEDNGQLNSGSGLGAVPGQPVIRGMMEAYNGRHFINEDGSYNLRYNTFYETDYMLDMGYDLKNEFQVVNGMTCLPREVLMPESIMGLEDLYTENTIANHKINPYDKTFVRNVLKRICVGDKNDPINEK